MVDVAEIKLWGQLVGAVRWDDREKLGYFQYAPSFLPRGWEIAPLKMPLSQGDSIFSFPQLRKKDYRDEDTFKGLPGVLADALPDRYGNHLINSWLVRRGREENSMNPVERLCFIGTRGVGALEFMPPYFDPDEASFPVEVGELVEISKRMLMERSSFATSLKEDKERGIREILKIGTSAGGARPKAVIAYNQMTGEVRSGQGTIPDGFDHWLLKLDGVSGEQFGESTGWGRVEYAYYLMARECGIEISESRLIEEGGRGHFMTKRFDREHNVKHHIQTLCGIQHYDFNDMQSYSYEQLFQTMRLLRLTYPQAEQMFRRMVFNVIATNYDDHTKNFSFILKKGEPWKLAPAYDLCFAYNPESYWVSQQTLSINGKRVGISKSDLLKVANENSIREPQQIIAQINCVVKEWHKYANLAGVNSELQQRIASNLNHHY